MALFPRECPSLSDRESELVLKRSPVGSPLSYNLSPIQKKNIRVNNLKVNTNFLQPPFSRTPFFLTFAFFIDSSGAGGESHANISESFFSF